jgi:hypothetical protein
VAPALGCSSITIQVVLQAIMDNSMKGKLMSSSILAERRSGFDNMMVQKEVKGETKGE